MGGVADVVSYVAAPFTGGASLLLGKGVEAFGNALRTPNPPGVSPSPSTALRAVQQVAAETSRRRSRARGYQSTILSQNFLAPNPNAPALKDTYGS